MEETFGFGIHLLVELYGCDPYKLSDVGVIFNLLHDLPSQVGMTRITPPLVEKFTTGKIKSDWGISGIVMLAESHASLHGFVDKQFLTFDLYSCNTFDTDKVVAILQDTFKPSKTESQVITRGHEFPRGELPVKKEKRYSAGRCLECSYYFDGSIYKYCDEECRNIHKVDF